MMEINSRKEEKLKIRIRQRSGKDVLALTMWSEIKLKLNLASLRVVVSSIKIQLAVEFSLFSFSPRLSRKVCCRRRI